MEKISCIIVDDEPLAAAKLKLFIEKVPFLELNEILHNGIDCINYLRNNSVDLVFLDVQMEDISGLQVIELSEKMPLVILTTAYDEYALKGYELNICDYLLKPYTFERFFQACMKASNQLKTMNSARPTNEFSDRDDNKKDYIFVKTEYKLQKIALSDILFIEGMRDYLMIHTTNANIMTLQNFSNIVQLLPKNDFYRIHKSFIIAISKIDNIERSQIVIGKNNIPISKTYRDSFFDYLKSLGMM